MLKDIILEFPGGLINGLRIWRSHCCGTCSIPDPGTSACCGCGQKQNLNRDLFLSSYGQLI